jgi:hypothetical protein
MPFDEYITNVPVDTFTAVELNIPFLEVLYP